MSLAQLADHLDNETAFRLVWLILDAHIAALNRRLSPSCISSTSLEDRL